MCRICTRVDGWSHVNIIGYPLSMTLCVAVQKLCNERARLSAAIIISIIHVTSATVLLDSIIIIIIIKPGWHSTLG